MNEHEATVTSIFDVPNLISSFLRSSWHLWEILRNSLKTFLRYCIHVKSQRSWALGPKILHSWGQIFEERHSLKAFLRQHNDNNGIERWKKTDSLEIDIWTDLAHDYLFFNQETSASPCRRPEGLMDNSCHHTKEMQGCRLRWFQAFPLLPFLFNK